jgi:hypothetical protein
MATAKKKEREGRTMEQMNDKCQAPGMTPAQPDDHDARARHEWGEGLQQHRGWGTGTMR